MTSVQKYYYSIINVLWDFKIMQSYFDNNIINIELNKQFITFIFN